MPRSSPISASSVRNFTFGVEDSLASTVGLLSGVASAQVGGQMIVLTGLILIITEAMSMGMGSFLSDQSVRQLTRHKDVPSRQSVSGALIMFFSYLFSGLIPLAPYVFIPPKTALWLSIILSLAALFLLGVINATIAQVPKLRQGIRMLILGGLVAIGGVFFGNLLHQVS